MQAKDKTESEQDMAEQQKEQIEKWNQMTALGFQTGRVWGDHQSPKSLPRQQK